MKKYTFVVVHGSWHTGELLKPMAKFLRTSGHIVHTPTLAGHGKDADKTVSHDDQVASIVDYIQTNDLDDFVLVGHSYGGTVISKVAEVMPKRIRRLVFWSAFVLEDGHSVYDEIPPYSQALFDQLRAASTPDKGIMLPFPMWREGFMNDADMALAKATYNKLSSEPESAFYDKLDLQKFYSLIKEQKLACSYLYCTTDTALPLGEYAWVPRYSNRLGLHRLVEMPGGHEVCFTNPQLLAQKLIEAGRD